MLRSQKVAIARLFSDLIYADRIVDTGEMECWNSLCQKYSIDKEIRIEARNITFADALLTIRSSDIQGLKDDLLGDCRSMTISDGYCAHSEALVMMALILMFDTRHTFKVEVFSIPRASFNIDLATSLYVESEYYESVNESIKANYRSIFKEFQLAGFHFVYPPSIIDHYRNTDPQLFRQILSFLAPSLSEAGIENAYRSIMKMTTAVFCKDLLCNKCGIVDLRNTGPSLLIKIGNGFVGESPYADYLKIEVSEDILSTVQRFVDSFSKMLYTDFYVVNRSEERDSQFHFHGFYKQLLDMFLIRKNIRSRIVIDPYKEEIFFPDIDAKAVGLHRRERTLYTLLLCSGKEGLNFSLPRSVGDMAEYNRRMERIQARYRIIYSMFGGDTSAVPDLSQPEIRRPIFSCLKRSLKTLPSLYNPQDYNLTKDRDGLFSVHVDPEIVYVARLDSDEPVPLLKSELYRKLREIT